MRPSLKKVMTKTDHKTNWSGWSLAGHWLVTKASRPNLSNVLNFLYYQLFERVREMQIYSRVFP
jgi:hypothetical protein